MRLNSTFISIFLFVSAVLSGPLREKDQLWFPSHVMFESTNGAPDGVYYYSHQYSCAFWEGADRSFTFATATFNILPPIGQHGYTTWVGIDSIFSCHDSWLAAGINSSVADGKTTYQAWCQWGKDEWYLHNVAITPHDVIRTSITMFSATSGAVLVENLNNGQASVYYVNSTRSLCTRDVSWGVMLHQIDETISFDTVTITNAKAYGTSGSIYEAEGAERILIVEDNKYVTSVETEGSTITIHHMLE